jgi:hypothetical protein
MAKGKKGDALKTKGASHQKAKDTSKKKADKGGGKKGASSKGAEKDAVAEEKPMTKAAVSEFFNKAATATKDGDIVKPLATKVAAEKPKLSALGTDNRYKGEGLHNEFVKTWLGTKANVGKITKLASRDPIAVQKIDDIKGERYLQDSGLKKAFWQKLHAKLLDPGLNRDRIYPVMKAAAGYDFAFKGKDVPADKVSPFSARNQGVDKMFKATTYDNSEYQSQVQSELESELGDPGLQNSGLGPTEVQSIIDSRLSGEEARIKTYRHMLAGGRDPMQGVDVGQQVAGGGHATWYAPGEITVDAANSAEVEFERLMTLGALQPEWYGNGTIVLNIQKDDAAMRHLKKPTAFDGLMSAMWVSRNQGNQTYGVTGGGAGEFLEANVTYADVTSASAVIPSDDFLSEIKVIADTVREKAKQAGVTDTTPTEEALRGNAIGASKTKDMYQGNMDRSTQEANKPSKSPEVPSKKPDKPLSKPKKAPGKKTAAAKGGTFDKGQQKPVR